MMKARPFYIAREGYPFIFLSLLAMAITVWLCWPLAVADGIFLAFCLYFFRDPERYPPPESQALLSPADGRVLKIETLETEPDYQGRHRKISIFMSPFDVHVNRIPCDGRIKKLRYYPGKFLVASLDKASLLNERNAVTLETDKGDEIVFIQIAGLIARRIVCYLHEGRSVLRGERYGMIRFGSRMEVCLPLHWAVQVKAGDRVKAGESILARWKGD